MIFIIQEAGASIRSDLYGFSPDGDNKFLRDRILMPMKLLLAGMEISKEPSWQLMFTYISLNLYAKTGQSYHSKEI